MRTLTNEEHDFVSGGLVLDSDGVPIIVPIEDEDDVLKRKGNNGFGNGGGDGVPGRSDFQDLTR